MSVAGKKVADYPRLVSEWHPTRNGNLRPADLAAGSNKKVWWRCSKGHEFILSPNTRTNNHRHTGQVGACSQCGGKKYWTWEQIVSTARSVAEKEGFLPPAARFQALGYAMLVQCIYKIGKTWEDLRKELASYDSSQFVSSRNGRRWHSHPEASLSNFLFARGIPHGKGKKYPDEYAKFSGKTYGYYDLEFKDKKDRTVDVEIWGDKPDGHNEKSYAKVRRLKEKFNRSNRNFLGIHYSDCYDDRRLSKILKSFIGVINPHVFVKPHDPFIETTHWSNADEVLEACQQIASLQPDGKFPAEDWLRKRGRWAKRPGPVYNTLSVYIKNWIGGIRKVRELIGQSENSTIQWNKQRALSELRQWFDTHGKSPNSVRREFILGKTKIDRKVFKRAARILAAIDKYVGSLSRAYAELGIIPRRNSQRKGPWTRFLDSYSCKKETE